MTLRGFAASAVAIMLATSAALAQQRPAAPSPPSPSPFQAPPPPSTPLFPPLMTPPAGGLTSPAPSSAPPIPAPAPDLFRVRPGDRTFTRTHVRPPFPVGGGSYFYSPEIAPQPPVAAVPRVEVTGMLRLSGTPASAEVFVDRFYVGTLADVEAQRVLTLPAGPHRVEIRAADYEPATFDVRIDPNDTITYRAALEHRRAPAPARAAAPAGATKMYVIPNCYLGNIPPRSDRLPRGCDIRHLRVIS